MSILSKKELIYQNAKQLLHDVGYNKMTIKEIARMSGVPVSLVHYYFSKKEEIIRTVYGEYVNNIDFFLYRQVPGIFSNTMLAHTVNNRIYYDIILKSPENSRIYQEVLENQSNYNLLEKYAQKIYDGYVSENKLIIPENLYKTYIIMNFGARREFFLEYFKGTVSLDIQEIVTAINGMFPRILRIDQHYVDSILLESMSIFNSLDCSELKFLI